MLGSSSDIYFVISWILQKTLAEDRGVVVNFAEERVEVEEEGVVIIRLDKNTSSPFTAT
jgi:hypothetical protein